MHPVGVICAGEKGMDLTPEENAIVEVVNTLRVDEAIPELKLDPLLNQVAEEHSQDMALKKVLDIGPPVYQTPFERASAKRLTDLNNLVVVAKAYNLQALKDFIQSDKSAEGKLLSPHMTHIGVGISSSGDGMKWLTIHMVERAIKFTKFMLETRSGVAPGKSITVYGVTTAEKVKAAMFLGQGPDTVEYETTKTTIPDSKGRFLMNFDLDLGKGEYGFIFWVHENKGYTKSNYFDIKVN